LRSRSARIPLLETAGLKLSADGSDLVMTVDVVETDTLGALEFLDGIPKPDTVQKIYDNLDLVRGTIGFLDSAFFNLMHATLRGLREMGIEPGEVGISEILLDAPHESGPSNYLIIGMCSQIDLSCGPVVLNVPPDLMGIVADAGFRIVADIGLAETDRDTGRKYLFLPPGYVGAIPGGYFVSKSITFDHLVVLVALANDGDTEVRIKEHLNIYPLKLADNPPPEIFHCKPAEQLNAMYATDFHFFQELDAVIQKEPEDAFPTELADVLASVGIRKGRTFVSNERMIRILNEAAAIGNATVGALALDPRKSIAARLGGWSKTLPFDNGGLKYEVNLESTVSPVSAHIRGTNQFFCNLALRS
jgi:hypothetical protein